jgi:hypothetical protein
VYGDRQQLLFDQSSPSHNYLWHAARAFFEEGGARLYISRVFAPLKSASGATQLDGRARKTISGGGTSVLVAARFPGAAGNMRVRLTLQMSENILGQDVNVATGQTVPRARGLLQDDVVVLRSLSSPLSSPATAVFAKAYSYFDTTSNQQTWRFHPTSGSDFQLLNMHPNPNPLLSDRIQVVTANVTVYPTDPNLPTLVYSNLALDATHQLSGASDSIEARFSPSPDSLDQARAVPIVITLTGGDGLTLLHTLFQAQLGQPGQPGLRDALLTDGSTDVQRSIDVVLEGGNDGIRPAADAYEGASEIQSTADTKITAKTGIAAFEDIDEISIVAAPGSTYGYEDGYRDDAATILGLLISHAARMRYRIAVLDSGDGQGIADVRALRAKLDSTYAALYYPWVTILDPVTRKEINLPPSGFVAGIYARNDINRAVYKAPANEVVNLALGFEKILNKAQQDVLNPLGINCFRYFEDRGYRLWGARTISSDPEWKYVNLRRYFAYLEHSIDKGTQWAVFEPNGDQLWASVRRTISDFLLNEWQTGALLGDKPEKAYFVRCDRTTMTQNDLDNGRLVCLIGVAPLRPAEFVIFRIGQWTADRT